MMASSFARKQHSNWELDRAVVKQANHDAALVYRKQALFEHNAGFRTFVSGIVVHRVQSGQVENVLPTFDHTK